MGSDIYVPSEVPTHMISSNEMEKSEGMKGPQMDLVSKLNLTGTFSIIKYSSI